MGEQVAARFPFKRRGAAGVRRKERMYIENCTQRVIEKITTSDSYYKIEEKNHSVTV